MTPRITAYVSVTRGVNREEVAVEVIAIDVADERAVVLFGNGRLGAYRLVDLTGVREHREADERRIDRIGYGVESVATELSRTKARKR